MFTPEQRSRLRSELLEEARRDRRITGAAITGSAASDAEDAWSDIDLAFGVADGADLSNVLSDWTALLYRRSGAVHHVDVRAGAWIYRVFLVAGALQVDLAFAPASEFRPLAPTFRLVFGTAAEARHLPPPPPADIIGLGWLYALHARSAIARRQWWQAEYMISGIRDHALALACLRRGLPAVHARGIDRLPPEDTAPFEAAIVRSLAPADIERAFRAAVPAFLGEVRHADPELAGRLESALQDLTDTRVAIV